MLIKNKGATLALLCLVCIAGVGLYINNNEYHHGDRDNKHYTATVDNDLSLFKSVSDWADANHDALEALSAISSVIVTIGLLFFTGVLASKTEGLYRETNSLRLIADQQRADMLRSIEASEKSAEAAVDQTVITRNGIEITGRAFVVPDIFLHKREEIGGIKGWSFRCVWKNTGNTPTKFLRMNFTRQYRVAAGPLPMNDGFVDGDDFPARAFLGPGNTRASSKLIIPEEVVELIKMDQAHAYLWGWVDYNDIFGNTPRDRTEFCVEIIVVGDPSNADCNFAYMSYGPFNGLDDECLRRPTPYPNNQP